MTKLKQLVPKMGKTYKDSEIITLGVNIPDPGRLPTGLFAFDLATGGGIPTGRVSIFYGTEDSMKTTLCLKLIANAQHLFPDRLAAFIDVEGVFSRDWATKLGVDTDNLVYSNPKNAEQMVDILEGILYADDVSVVVVDSLAALITQHELEKSAEDVIVGRTGLIINKLYRKTSRALGDARGTKRDPTLVLINQIRFKINAGYGNPETMPGGPAPKFASSMTIRCYGKDIMDSAISNSLPAYKEVNIGIKKHKVPVLAKKAQLLVALQPIEQYGLHVGESYDWNTLVAYLKSTGLFVKAGNGWQLTHPDTGEIEDFKKQAVLKKKVFEDVDYGINLKSAVIKVLMDSDEVIE